MRSTNSGNTKPGGTKLRNTKLRKALFAMLACLLVGAAAAAAQAPAANSPALQKVLQQMDRAAAEFRSAQADFVWDQYQRVVDETDRQAGAIYFRKQRDEIQMAAHIAQPDQKQVLFAEGKVRLYQPRIEQVTEYQAGKDRAEFESFLVLGFGGSGQDLVRTFEVAWGGTETVDGVETARLELVPRSQRVRGMFARIVLWIDPARGVSLQQQFFEPSGDHRLARYTNIRLNQRLGDDPFRLKTTSRTRFITPN
jgi:outer membrane lipoprotein-sorting protein